MQTAASSSTRLRCDPTDYAKRQQAARDRAKELREQRQRGVVSNDHTFAPKINPRSRSSISSREEQDRSAPPPSHSSNSYDDIPIRPNKSFASKRDAMNPEEAPQRPPRQRMSNNNNHDEQASDALDNLSRKYPPRRNARHDGDSGPPSSYQPAPLEPEHDTLFREVKRATGKEINDGQGRKANAPRASGGPCLRNSSCTCAQCAGAMQGSIVPTEDVPLRRRETRHSGAGATDAQRSYAHPGGERNLPPQSEIESSLSLLKSKMSRRKARSAPTNQAPLFDENQTPRAIAHSARELTSRSQEPSSYPSQPRAVPQPSLNASRSNGPVRRTPSNASRKPLPRHAEEQEHDDDDMNSSTQDDSFHSEYRTPPPGVDEYAEDDMEMRQCSTCQRRFNVDSFEKHSRVCAKVFAGQRKVFNMKAKRLEGTGAEKVQKKGGAASGGDNARSLNPTERPIKSKQVDWKQKSNAFREAMKASRDVSKALKEGRELPPPKPSAPDPSLIQCEYCSRRFNEKAAERHIPFCREKSQRDNISRGPAKKTGIAKPSAAARGAATRRR